MEFKEDDGGCHRWKSEWSVATRASCLSEILTNLSGGFMQNNAEQEALHKEDNQRGKIISVEDLS
jgi:hypothetical protein